VTVEGRSTPVPTGLTVGQALGRLGLPVAGDLLAVDHSVLRKSAYPPRVLVNGQPASATRRLGRGDRVAVSPGQNRMEPVARVAQQLPASQPGNPIRSLPTGPAQAVLDRGELSGRSVDPADWHPGVTADQLVWRVLAAVRPGAIVLLHDGGGDRSATVAALPAIIDGLRRLGLTPTVMAS
jgi:sulfur carrier protein ThiS